jgi:hypothetical protein
MTRLDEPAIRRVRSPDDWRTVRALRFDALAASREIDAPQARSYTDAFDEAPETATYLLARSGHAVGTTRSSVRSPRVGSALPSERVFGAEMRTAFGTQAVIVEASLTFVDAKDAVDPQETLMRLFKMHVWRCAAENADALVVAVREPQMGFYRRRFNMEILSGAERYPGLATPRVLMGLGWREHSAELLRRIPVLAASAEDGAAFERL